MRVSKLQPRYIGQHEHRGRVGEREAEHHWCGQCGPAAGAERFSCWRPRCGLNGEITCLHSFIAVTENEEQSDQPSPAHALSLATSRLLPSVARRLPHCTTATIHLLGRRSSRLSRLSAARQRMGQHPVKATCRPPTPPRGAAARQIRVAPH
eukprot:2975267-Prymnesium_polylepis.1